jgi:hypothetical protein
VDADGVTGPEAGRAGDAAALPAADRLDEIRGLGRAHPDRAAARARQGPREEGPRQTYAKRIAVLAACAAANTDTFLGERFGRPPTHLDAKLGQHLAQLGSARRQRLSRAGALPGYSTAAACAPSSGLSRSVAAAASADTIRSAPPPRPYLVS